MISRSPSGLRNRSTLLQYEIEVVIETDPAKPSETAAEEKFWKVVAEHYTGKKVRVVKRGGKTSAIDYAKNFDDHGIKNYLCALDRDFDDLWSPYVYPTNTVITNGYSYESDCIFAESVSRVVELSLGGVVEELTDLQKNIMNRIMTNIQNIRMLVIADQISVQRGHGFFHRKSRQFQRLLQEESTSGTVTPNLTAVRSRKKAIKPEFVRSALRVDRTDHFRRCYGKLALWLSHASAVIEIRKAKKSSITHEFHLNVLVDFATKCIQDNTFPFDAHYSREFSSLTLV